MKLNQEDKELNYCYSCEFRKFTEFNRSICKLTGSEPSFSFECDNYKYDNNINIKKLKVKLEAQLKDSTNGFLNTNSIINLIEPSCGNTIKKSKINAHKIFRINPLLKYLYIAICATSLLFFTISMFKTPVEFNKTSLIYLLLSIGMLFLIRKEFLSKARITIDRHGLLYNERIFLWKFIEGLYIQEIDNGSDSDSEEYLIILLKSGKQFKFDISRINFFTKMRFKGIINSFRNIELAKESMHNKSYTSC